VSKSHASPASSTSGSSTSHAPAAQTDMQGLYGNAFVAEHGACDHAHDPQPGGGGGADLDTTRPVGGDVPAGIRDAAMNSVGAVPRGRTLLDSIRTARGDLNISTKWSDQGTYHSAGSIWIDRRADPSHLVGSMAHELVHLLTFVSGQAANARTMGRQEFVDAKMTDEINAQATAYVVLMQSGRLEGETGLSEFSTWLTTNRPDLAVCPTDDAAAAHWTAVDGVAKTWLEGKYRNEWTTSNTHENYYTYWGGYWDSLHP
jgi:hypothetical protein